MRAYKHRDGYRRLHILLRREGLRLNHKRLFRLYREERLVSAIGSKFVTTTRPALSRVSS
jgi:transposase InsO family protein